MKIKRVEHIAIAVDSLNQSASILRDAFGINIEYEEQVGSTGVAMRGPSLSHHFLRRNSGRLSVCWSPSLRQMQLRSTQCYRACVSLALKGPQNA
jgi:hypothetical protein